MTPKSKRILRGSLSELDELLDDNLKLFDPYPSNIFLDIFFTLSLYISILGAESREDNQLFLKIHLHYL